jgi:hypothetical protein
MVSTTATVGMVILIVGLIVGVYAAYNPVSAQQAVTYTLINSSVKVDPNDYQSKNAALAPGDIVTITASITNQTVVFLYVMNQAQYYTFYGCAPFCRGAPNGSAAVGAGAPIGASVPVATLINKTLTSSANPFNYTIPASGTYYFVLDNTMGTSYTTYVNQSATGNTLGSLSLVNHSTQNTQAVNWTYLAVGVVLLIVGGAIATATWGSKPKPKPSMTSTVPAVPPTTPPVKP